MFYRFTRGAAFLGRALGAGPWRAASARLRVKAWTTKKLLLGKALNGISLTLGAPFTMPSATGHRAYTERLSKTDLF
jgi:hypothetical protein